MQTLPFKRLLIGGVLSTIPVLAVRGIIALLISGAGNPLSVPALLGLLGFLLIIPGVLVGYLIPFSTQGLTLPIIYSAVVWFAVGVIAAFIGRSNMTRLLVWCGLALLIAFFGFIAFFFVFSA